jgi:two-component system, NarL family, sensor histidine kinase UhpB
MLKAGYVSVFLLAFLLPANASQGTDSLLINKASVAFNLASVNSDSALVMAKAVLEESRLFRSGIGEGNASNALGWVYMHKGQLDSSLVWLNRARDLFLSENSALDVIRANINLTEVLNRQSRFGEALILALEADSMAAASGHLPLLTDTKRLLGILYRESGDPGRAVIYFNEAIDGFERQGDLRRLVNTSISMSILLRRMGDYNASLEALNRCLQLTSDRSENDYQMAMIREHLGETYYMLGQYEESLREYLAAYRLFEKLGNMGDLAYEAIVVGKTMKALEMYNEAEFYLRRAYTISDSLGMLSYRYDASSELASLFEVAGRWEEAYAHLAVSVKLKDSLDQSKQLQQLTELRERYESEKQSTEISLLRAAISAENDLARRRMQLQYITLALLLAVSGIAYLSFNRFRLKQKLQEQLIRNQISGDLHDDIGSTLSSIDINSRIARLKIDDADTVKIQLDKIQQNTRAIMDSMSHIVWSIHPENDSIDKVIYRMKDFAAEVLESQGIRFVFITETSAMDTRINPLIRKNLYLIYKEAINNAAKYSRAGEVTCTLGLVKNVLELRILDNGVGFDTGKRAETGNGIRNMKQRAEQMSGSIVLTSNTGSGTAISVKVPVT